MYIWRIPSSIANRSQCKSPPWKKMYEFPIGSVVNFQPAMLLGGGNSNMFYFFPYLGFHDPIWWVGSTTTKVSLLEGIYYSDPKKMSHGNRTVFMLVWEPPHGSNLCWTFRTLQLGQVIGVSFKVVSLDGGTPKKPKCWWFLVGKNPWVCWAPPTILGHLHIY